MIPNYTKKVSAKTQFLKWEHNSPDRKFTCLEKLVSYEVLGFFHEFYGAVSNRGRSYMYCFRFISNKIMTRGLSCMVKNLR